MRVVQPEGVRGSLKWIQRLVETDRADWLPERLRGVEWRSPLRDDDWAEYRDSAFLHRLGVAGLDSALSEFWPARGPQWDALGILNGRPVLVEAKAHVGEFLTPGTKAGEGSRRKISAALEQVAEALGSQRGALWHDLYFQYANRLAHLWFLHHQGVAAELVFVSFIGDGDMRGPEHPETWYAAFSAADYALGLPSRHALTPYIHHVMPHVRAL